MSRFITSVPYTQFPASFNYVGSNQTFIVPAGVKSITVYMWGAGGGGTTTQYGATLGPGGTGAFVTGQISVTPGQTLYVLVGQGGGGMQSYYQVKLSPGGFPGGGNGYYAAGGGGYSGIFTSSTPSQGNALIVAGAGGGAVVDGHTYGGSATNLLGTAQNGGNRNNGNETTTPGLGATAAGGGAGGTPPPAGFGTGSAGAALKGGDGCTTDTSANNYGGGGGAGYWGGGGGSSFGGGGGGNSYANSTYVTNFTGANTQSSLTTAVSAPGSNNPYYQAGIAASAAGQNGGNGLVIITYPKPPTGSLQTLLIKQVYPSVFSPLQLSNCSLWLDAKDIAGNGTTRTNGATVSTWVDKSGNGKNLTAVNTPTYASSNLSVYLDGSSYLQNTNFNFSNHTLFIVSKQTSGAGPLYTNTGSTDTTGFFPIYGSTYYLVQSDNTWLNTTTPFSNGTTYIYSIQYDSLSNINVWSTGSTSPVITGTAGTIARDSFILGRRIIYPDTMNGNVFEVLQYNRDLGQSERQQVEGYLAEKWGLRGSLPGSHPYYSVSPTGVALGPTGITTRFFTGLPFIPTTLPLAINYYDVTSNAWTNTWQPYLIQMAAANSAAVARFSSNVVIGASPNNYAYATGGVLAPNGKIYCSPFNQTNIGVLDRVANTFTASIATSLAAYSIGSGGVLAPNGKIYIPPNGASVVGVVDPASNSFTSFGSSSRGYVSGVLAPNGKIYCPPNGFATVGVIDPVLNSFTTIDTSSVRGYYGGVLAPNGKIYCIPATAGYVGVIDPVANNFTTPVTGDYAGGYAYSGGVLAPNGKIYCIPLNATAVGVIDPVANTFTTFGTSPGSYAYSGGVLGPDGKIYCVPVNARNMAVIDPVANTFTILTSLTTTDAYNGGVLGSDGNIYFIPQSAIPVGVISFSGLRQLPNSNYCLSAWTNKL
jgi:Glycine rich protein